MDPAELTAGLLSEPVLAGLTEGQRHQEGDCLGVQAAEGTPGMGRVVGAGVESPPPPTRLRVGPRQAVRAPVLWGRGCSADSPHPHVLTSVQASRNISDPWPQHAGGSSLKGSGED